MAVATSHFHVIDHHETNERNLRDLSFAYFAMNQSACQLAWKYFFGSITPIPLFIDYIGLRDIWKHKENPNALYFNTAFDITEDFLAIFQQYYNDPPLTQKTIDEGRVKHQTWMLEIKKIANTATIVDNWHGYKTFVVKTGYPYTSDVGDYLLQDNPGCIVVCWGEGYRYSLRSRDGQPNVSKIAEKYGGGGHNSSAGFGSDK